MRSRDFPSYRLRHAIRVWRYRRRHPWQFGPGARRPNGTVQTTSWPCRQADEVDRRVVASGRALRLPIDLEESPHPRAIVLGELRERELRGES